MDVWNHLPVMIHLRSHLTSTSLSSSRFGSLKLTLAMSLLVLRFQYGGVFLRDDYHGPSRYLNPGSAGLKLAACHPCLLLVLSLGFSCVTGQKACEPLRGCIWTETPSSRWRGSLLSWWAKWITLQLVKSLMDRPSQTMGPARSRNQLSKCHSKSSVSCISSHQRETIIYLVHVDLCHSK